MIAQQIGLLIKSQRLAAHLTQSDLAQRAAVSRTTLSRLEGGKAPNVQADVLDRLLASLNIQPRVESSASPSQARLQARQEQNSRLLRQRERHLRLMLTLLCDPTEAPANIDRARAMLDLWRRNRTCSDYFIERWQALLDLPPAQLVQAMLELGDWEDALFQNTPWSWAWNSNP
jgi:transcriptional regulator with XRE-family HTH domain